MTDLEPQAVAVAGPGKLEATREFLLDTRAEMDKVTWPTRAELLQQTKAVLISALALGVVIGLLDVILQKLLIDTIGKLGSVISTAMEYRWYAVQTTSGHENKVRSLLGMRIKDDPRPEGQKLVAQALVPTQEVVEIKNGKKVTVERKLFPGYVIVQMGMSQEAQHVVNSIQGVIKFVGTGKSPLPLRDDEVNRLLGIAEAEADSSPKEEIPFLPGQAVEITEGPFSDFNGVVEEVIADKGKVKVSVSLFGRPTTVELDYLQLRGH